jgi:dienelactone hydrolase
MHLPLLFLSVAAIVSSPPSDPEAVARQVVQDLVAGRLDAVAARFDDHLRQALPVAQLAEAWKQITAQAGAFQSITGTFIEEKDGLRVVFVVCAFERGPLEFVVPFDAQMRMPGFRARPPVSHEPWAAPSYAHPDAFVERPVTVGSGQWALPGVLAVPRGVAGPFPAVVLVHGSGPQDEDETIGPNKPFKDLAWGLASQRIAVLRYVKRTRRYGKEMKESIAALTLADETVDDARLAVAALASQPEIDPKRIFVIGHSLGGYAAPRIASGNPQVAGLVLMAATTRPLEDLVVAQIRYLVGLGGTITPEGQKKIDEAEQNAAEIRNPLLKPGMTVHLLGAALPASYFLDLRSYHPAEMAAALHLPVFVLQGQRDYQAQMVDFDSWKKALGSDPRASFKVYPALNHLFIAGEGPSSEAEYLRPGHVDETVVRDIAAWVSAPGLPAKQSKLSGHLRPPLRAIVE